MSAAADCLPGARFVASPNRDARPPGVSVSLLVIHAISVPAGRFGGDAIERLFTNRLDPGAHPEFRALSALRVSSHFLLRRDGELVQFAPVAERAWHAGESTWRGRARCNDFSVGVEFEGDTRHAFTPEQSAAFRALVAGLRRLLPIRDIAGHRDIAPHRKWDPGERFEWRAVLGALARDAIARQTG